MLFECSHKSLLQYTGRRENGLRDVPCVWFAGKHPESCEEGSAPAVGELLSVTRRYVSPFLFSRAVIGEGSTIASNLRPLPPQRHGKRNYCNNQSDHPVVSRERNRVGRNTGARTYTALCRTCSCHVYHVILSLTFTQRLLRDRAFGLPPHRHHCCRECSKHGSCWLNL